MKNHLVRGVVRAEDLADDLVGPSAALTKLRSNVYEAEDGHWQDVQVLTGQIILKLWAECGCISERGSGVEAGPGGRTGCGPHRRPGPLPTHRGQHCPDPTGRPRTEVYYIYQGKIFTLVISLKSFGSITTSWLKLLFLILYKWFDIMMAVQKQTFD